MKQRLTVSSCSAAASLSTDGKFFTVSNLLTGFDIYAMDSEHPLRSLIHQMGEQYPTPVIFIHGGHAVVGGSTVGEVDLWDFDSGRKLHSLLHLCMCYQFRSLDLQLCNTSFM